MQNAKCQSKMRNAKCKMQNCKMQNAKKKKTQTKKEKRQKKKGEKKANCKLQIANCKLQLAKNIKNTYVALYGSREALVYRKIILRGLGSFCRPGEPILRKSCFIDFGTLVSGRIPRSLVSIQAFGGLSELPQALVSSQKTRFGILGGVPRQKRRVFLDISSYTIRF